MGGQRHFIVGRLVDKGIFGQSLVEFALTLPIFLLITIGVIDLGRGVISSTIISNAAREGARAGVYPYPSSSNASILGAVNGQTAFIGGIPLAASDPGTGTWVSISPAEDPVQRGSGTTITVDVHYRFHPITPLLSNLVGSGIDMSARSVMMIE